MSLPRIFTSEQDISINRADCDTLGYLHIPYQRTAFRSAWRYIKLHDEYLWRKPQTQHNIILDGSNECSHDKLYEAIDALGNEKHIVTMGNRATRLQHDVMLDTFLLETLHRCETDQPLCDVPLANRGDRILLTTGRLDRAGWRLPFLREIYRHPRLRDRMLMSLGRHNLRSLGDKDFSKWLKKHKKPLDKNPLDSTLLCGWPCDPELYARSRLQIVIETESPLSPMSFVTEKTYRAIAMASPFVWIGSRRGRQYLEEQGFAFYHDFIYNPHEFIKAIDGVLNTDIQTLENKTQNNKQLFFDLAKDHRKTVRKLLVDKISTKY